MPCKCGSKRIATVSAKSSDLNYIFIGEKEHNGYVPTDMEIGKDDYLEFDYCLDCGKIQGEFPLPYTKLEEEGTPS